MNLRRARQGTTGQGTAWQGTAGQGTAWQGMDSPASNRPTVASNRFRLVPLICMMGHQIPDDEGPARRHIGTSAHRRIGTSAQPSHKQGALGDGRWAMRECITKRHLATMPSILNELPAACCLLPAC
jgi:hypothetical protein